MKERKQKNMQNTDAVAWTKKLVGIESTNPGTEEYEIAGFLEHEIRAVLSERGELKKDYTIIMVTHNMDLVSYLNKRVIRLKDGRVQSDNMRGAEINEA